MTLSSNNHARLAAWLVSVSLLGGALAAGCGNSVSGGECEDDGDCVATCEVGGTTYEAGETIPGECGTCVCNDNGTVDCPAADCIGPVCELPDGTTYQVGETWEDEDGCNTCECYPGGGYDCTLIACVSCTYGGVDYAVGVTFPSLDGCNTCECLADGGVACTEIACACDPESEWWREYIGESPEECQVIDYACPENTTSFSNDYGCGCEQSPECPQAFDCQPPTTCDVEMIQSECPYSVIAL